MSGPLIEHTFTATGQSPSELGYDLGRAQAHGYAGVKHTLAAAQVVRTAGTGNYSVTLQRGIRRANNAISWNTDKTFTQADTSDVQEINLVPGCEYRFNCGTIGASNTIVCILN